MHNVAGSQGQWLDGFLWEAADYAFYYRAAFINRRVGKVFPLEDVCVQLLIFQDYTYFYLLAVASTD